MAVEMDIEYQGQLRCAATHGPSKQTIATDAPVDNGGKGEAFSPTDLVGAAAGTCIVTVMGIAAQKMGVDIAGTRVHVTKEMVADPVRRIGAITVTVTLPKGLALSEDDKKRIEQAGATCPVKQSLHPGVRVNLSFVYP
jgi:putative redox protein